MNSRPRVDVSKPKPFDSLGIALRAPGSGKYASWGGAKVDKAWRCKTGVAESQDPSSLVQSADLCPPIPKPYLCREDAWLCRGAWRSELRSHALAESKPRSDATAASSGADCEGLGSGAIRTQPDQSYF